MKRWRSCNIKIKRIVTTLHNSLPQRFMSGTGSLSGQFSNRSSSAEKINNNGTNTINRTPIGPNQTNELLQDLIRVVAHEIPYAPQSIPVFFLQQFIHSNHFSVEEYNSFKDSFQNVRKLLEYMHDNGIGHVYLSADGLYITRAADATEAANSFSRYYFVSTTTDSTEIGSPLSGSNDQTKHDGNTLQNCSPVGEVANLLVRGRPGEDCRRTGKERFGAVELRPREEAENLFHIYRPFFGNVRESSRKPNSGDQESNDNIELPLNGRIETDFAPPPPPLGSCLTNKMDSEIVDKLEDHTLKKRIQKQEKSIVYTAEMLQPFVPFYFIPLNTLLENILPEKNYTKEHIKTLFSPTNSFEMVQMPTDDNKDNTVLRYYGSDLLKYSHFFHSKGSNPSLSEENRWEDNYSNSFVRSESKMKTMHNKGSTGNDETNDRLLSLYEPDPFLAHSFIYSMYRLNAHAGGQTHRVSNVAGEASREDPFIGEGDGNVNNAWIPLAQVYLNAPNYLKNTLNKVSDSSWLLAHSNNGQDDEIANFFHNFNSILYFSQMQHYFQFTPANGGSVSLVGRFFKTNVPNRERLKRQESERNAKDTHTTPHLCLTLTQTSLTIQTSPTPTVVEEVYRYLCQQPSAVFVSDLIEICSRSHCNILSERSKKLILAYYGNFRRFLFHHQYDFMLFPLRKGRRDFYAGHQNSLDMDVAENLAKENNVVDGDVRSDTLNPSQTPKVSGFSQGPVPKDEDNTNAYSDDFYINQYHDYSFFQLANNGGNEEAIRNEKSRSASQRGSKRQLSVTQNNLLFDDFLLVDIRHRYKDRFTFAPGVGDVSVLSSSATGVGNADPFSLDKRVHGRAYLDELELKLEKALLEKNRMKIRKYRRQIAQRSQPENKYVVHGKEFLLQDMIRLLPPLPKHLYKGGIKKDGMQKYNFVSMRYFLKHVVPHNMLDFLPDKPSAFFLDAMRNNQGVLLFEFRYRSFLCLMRQPPLVVSETGVSEEKPMLPPGTLRFEYSEQELLFMISTELSSKPRTIVDLYGRLPFFARESIKKIQKERRQIASYVPQSSKSISSSFQSFLLHYDSYFAITHKGGNINIDNRNDMVTLLDNNLLRCPETLRPFDWDSEGRPVLEEEIDRIDNENKKHLESVNSP